MIADAASIADSSEYATALAELSRVLMLSGRDAEAIATADRALELASRHDLMRAVVEALINKGTGNVANRRALHLAPARLFTGKCRSVIGRIVRGMTAANARRDDPKEIRCRTTC